MLEKIKAYSGTMTAVFSALVVLYGVFKTINQISTNAKDTKEIKQELQQIRQLIPMVRLDSIERAVNVMNYTLTGMDGKVEKISSQFTRHLTRDKSVTKEELMQIMNELNQKKLRPIDTLIPKILIRKIP